MKVFKSPINRGFVNIGKIATNILHTQRRRVFLVKEVDNFLSEYRESFSHSILEGKDRGSKSNNLEKKIGIQSS
ncbi:MAG: hypothetical protein ACK4TN_02160, partial [Brevinematales bacterium]